jgi:pyruvate formate lyase activating enzyme
LHLQGIELLPYHLLGRNKWAALGLAYPLDGVQTPPLQDVLKVVEQLELSGVNVICDAKRQAAAQAVGGAEAL